MDYSLVKLYWIIIGFLYGIAYKKRNLYFHVAPNEILTFHMVFIFVSLGFHKI